MKSSATATHLKVPFYKQHYDFTCGPASLMMAMKYFDEHLRSATKNPQDLAVGQKAK